MKKVFLTYTILVALSIVSCKDKAASATDSETTTEIATEESSSETLNSDTDIPDFSDSDVQDYVEAYESYIEDYKKAVESKDMTAFSALATKGQDLATRAQEVTGKVSGADAEKLNAYMTTKAAELQAMTKKMME